MLKKTELIIFCSHTKKLDHSLKFKLHGKRLTPAQSVKYLGMLLDEHLKWTKQVTQAKIKLNRAIGILSNLQNMTNRCTLKSDSHLPKKIVLFALMKAV